MGGAEQRISSGCSVMVQVTGREKDVVRSKLHDSGGHFYSLVAYAREEATTTIVYKQRWEEGANSIVPSM